MNRICLFGKNSHVFIRQFKELDAIFFLGGRDLLGFLLFRCYARLGAHIPHGFDQYFLKIGRQLIIPGLVKQPDEKALGIVQLGKVFGHLKFFGDAADGKGVIQSGDNALL